MELEIKHITAYLPYKLTGVCTEENQGVELILGINQYKNCDEWYIITDIDDCDIKMFKPILKPLSELNQEGEIHTPEYIQSCTYQHVEYLLENHYDIYGLIDNGLAIDINTL